MGKEVGGEGGWPVPPAPGGAAVVEPEDEVVEARRPELAGRPLLEAELFAVAVGVDGAGTEGAVVAAGDSGAAGTGTDSGTTSTGTGVALTGTAVTGITDLEASVAAAGVGR